MHMSIYEMYILILVDWKKKEKRERERERERERKEEEFFCNKRKGRIEPKV